ncbi:corticotropin-releasing diuretic hormone 44 isoform X3 [Anticarsia gemmatalis]|uniref:corticotropin-releasing diuretic hormone 44 isoform X3 n=1 Tax=Anticarsia gemmatalis TaxID=129554 RepID=UPI003F761481
MMWWALWCAVVVAGGVGAAAAPAPDALSPLDMVQMDSPTPDDESLGYVSTMGGRYAAGAPWLYLLAEVPRDSQVASSELDVRPRRSFSVNPAVEVLQRGALNNYMEKIAQKNRSFLDRVGKRGHWSVQN